MRVSLKWLSDYIDLPTSDVDELKRTLDYLGHQVEDVARFDVGWTSVVIGRVERIEPHPDADNVRVTHVDLGDGDLQQIICGAWNFDEGAVVPVAVPGAVLPGGFEIGRRTIRGVTSHGMICSERELGLGDVHEGIMVLEPDAPVGKPFESILELPDVVFDIDITNNRPDVMGMVGVARELAAWYDVEFRVPEPRLPTVPGSPATTVTISAPDGCNRFVAREIRNVAIGPSPLWVRERLRKAGVRAISNVVDVTNYVMMELGHPLHAFDAARIAGDHLDVRWARPGETLETLDGAERKLTTQDLVIVDDEGPTSLAAVMGGARSEVRATTTRVLMEAASWHPPVVMYTSRRHDLRSEASARFERGVDPNLAPLANARASEMLVELGGGEILEEMIDVVANPVEPWSIRLQVSEAQRMLGDRFTSELAAALLRRLHLDVTAVDDELVVTIPTYRRDLTRPADLMEELARMADYDTFPATVPTGPAGHLTREQQRERRLLDALRGLGLHQAMNLPFVSSSELLAFDPEAASQVVSVRNPLRDDQSKLRQSLIPALLRNLRDNRNRGAATVALFETGRVFFAKPWSDDPRVPHQPVRLGIAVVGPFGASELGSAGSPADGATALAIVDALASALGVPIERRAASHPGFHDGRTADLLIAGEVVGVAGELHPDVAKSFDLDARVGVVELDVAPLVAPQPAVQMRDISTYPYADFDLSFDVSQDLRAADLLAATVAVSDLVERAEFFDEYRDGTSRSLAVTYRLRAPDRTLENEEIRAVRSKMIEAANGLGATLRGGSSEEE